MARVLVVDDEPGMLFALQSLLESRGDEAVQASSAREALERLEGVHAVVTDFAMPEMNGLELLHAIRERDQNLPVILLTAHGSERLAVKAIRAGAYEYICKPFDVDEMSMVLDRALEARELRVQNSRLSAERALGRHLVADSRPMRALLDGVARIAPRNLPVLIRGETGTGKELIATLLHAQGARTSKPLVRFNCAALPAELAESELFGHAKGAFTGAVSGRRGYFEQADGGTLVLDEVGELPMPIQAKLLRALQEGEIQPVGGKVTRVDVRLVACTNRDLLAEVKAGRFREDLYYRLAVVELVVPPLRDRPDDIPGLIAEFATRYADRFGVPGLHFTPAAVAELGRRPWPGNVRQLENYVARVVALSTRPEIDLSDLELASGPPAPMDGDSVPEPPTSAEGAAVGDQGPPPSLREQLDALERSVIARMLAATDGNQSEAARRLGMSRSALIDRIRKYGLSS